MGLIRSIHCKAKQIHFEIDVAFGIRKRTVVDADCIEARPGDIEIGILGDSFGNRYHARYGGGADKIGKRKVCDVNVEHESCEIAADESGVFGGHPSRAKKIDSADPGRLLVAERSPADAKYVAERRLKGCWRTEYGLDMRGTSFDCLLECSSYERSIGFDHHGFRLIIVGMGSNRSFEDFALAGDEFENVGGIAVVDSARRIPSSVPHGEESVGYVGVLPGEFDLLRYDLHDDSPLKVSIQILTQRRGEAESSRDRTARSSASPSLRYSALDALRGGDEFSLCRSGDYACRGVPLPKKKGERHFRAERSGGEIFRERQHHRRVSARFRREFDRVIDGLIRFGVRRLPRGDNPVRRGVVLEICPADSYFGRCENLLVLLPSDRLDVLNRGADAPVVHALPVELARLAAKVLLALGADVDFVALADHPGHGVDLTLQLWMDSQPTVEQDVVPILSEALDGFEKAVYRSVIGVELPALHVLVLHREVQTPGSVEHVLLDDASVQNGLGPVLRVLAGHDFVAERGLLSVGRDVFHMSLASCFCSPLRFGRFVQNGTRRPCRSPLTPVRIRLGDCTPYTLCLSVNRIFKLFATSSPLCGWIDRDNSRFSLVNTHKYDENFAEIIFGTVQIKVAKGRDVRFIAVLIDVHFGGCGNQETLVMRQVHVESRNQRPPCCGCNGFCVAQARSIWLRDREVA